MENNLILIKPSHYKRKIIDKVVIHVKDDPEDTNIPASNQNDIDYIKEQLVNIVDHRNTTKYAPNGTVVITPRYLKTLPYEIVDLIIVYVSDERKSKQSLQNDLYQCSLINKQFYHQTNRLLWHTPVISNAGALKRFITGLTNTQIIQQSTNPSDSLTKASGKYHHHHPVPHNISMSKHHVRQLDVIGSFWEYSRFSRILPCLGLLETLIIKDIDRVYTITDELIHHLPRWCPYLITLSLDPTMMNRASCFNAIVEHCHQFRKLELYISRNNHQQQNAIFNSLVSCPSLTTLHLYGGNDSHLSRHLSKNTVLSITKLYQLTDFSHVGSNMILTVDGFVAASNMASIWPRLSSLRMESAGALTDAIMIPFIVHHPHLQSLDLDATRFSNATLNTIVNHLPHITHVRFVANRTITSVGVYKLIRHCHDLKLAEFSGCDRVIHSMIEFSGFQANDVAALTLAQIKNIRETK